MEAQWSESLERRAEEFANRTLGELLDEKRIVSVTYEHYKEIATDAAQSKLFQKAAMRYQKYFRWVIWIALAEAVALASVGVVALWR